MPIDPNRPWGRSSASAAAPSPCFASPARRDSDAAKKEAPKAKPAAAKTIAAKPAKAAAKPKKSAATAKPKKTAAAAAGTKRRALEKKVVAKPKKSPAVKPPAWSRISRAASVMVIQGEISAHTFPLDAKYFFFQYNFLMFGCPVYYDPLFLFYFHNGHTPFLVYNLKSESLRS